MCYIRSMTSSEEAIVLVLPLCLGVERRRREDELQGARSHMYEVRLLDAVSG